ncbi:MAG: RNA-binding protein [Deltaproteobacteria bacterium]|jgi:RNA recognition motif-containing protein|nr:RNA-binding protein [Deltaproteobacteria bacterium]
MLITLFVGNYPYETQPAELLAVFSRFGRVDSVKLISDQLTGRSKGFGFIKIEESAGRAAIKALHRADFSGRPLNVREAGPVRREITLADNREIGNGFSPAPLESEAFVQNYWQNQGPQLSSVGLKRQTSYNQCRSIIPS